MATIPTPTPSQETMEALRKRIGLAEDDTSRDSEIVAAYVVSIRWMENYLDRYLVAGTYIEDFVHQPGYSLSLKAYPVESVVSVNGDNSNPIPRFYVDPENGVMFLEGYTSQRKITVEYTMAELLTGPLYLAFLLIFDQVFAAAESNGGSAVGNGVIKSISSDGANIQFDTSGGDNAAGIDSESGLPNMAAAIMHSFRRENC